MSNDNEVIAPALSPLRAGLFLLAGPLLWAGYFGVVYGLHTAACAFGGSTFIEAVPIAIVAVGLIVLVALGAILAVSKRAQAGIGASHESDGRTFLLSAGRLLGLLAFVAIALTAFAGAMLPVCQQLR